MTGPSVGEYVVGVRRGLIYVLKLLRGVRRLGVKSLTTLVSEPMSLGK